MKIKHFTSSSTNWGIAPIWAILAVSLATAHSGYGITQEILDNAVLVEEFLFDDADGTAINEVSNSANSGNSFDTDTDTADVTTNGSGQLNASLKSNTAFGSNYIDFSRIDSGVVYAWMELTWDFQSTFDASETEEIRLSLLNNDPRGTEITAQWELGRTGSSALTIGGTANGTGVSDIAAVEFNGGSMTQSSTFIAVVEADLDNDEYSVHYSSDAGANYTIVGTGQMDATRGVDSLRMVLNNDFSGDDVLIDRLAFATAVPEPAHFGLILSLFGSLWFGLQRSRRGT